MHVDIFLAVGGGGVIFGGPATKFWGGGCKGSAMFSSVWETPGLLFKAKLVTHQYDANPRVLESWGFRN